MQKENQSRQQLDSNEKLKKKVRIPKKNGEKFKKKMHQAQNYDKKEQSMSPELSSQFDEDSISIQNSYSQKESDFQQGETQKNEKIKQEENNEQAEEQENENQSQIKQKQIQNKAKLIKQMYLRKTSGGQVNQIEDKPQMEIKSEIIPRNEKMQKENKKVSNFKSQLKFQIKKMYQPTELQINNQEEQSPQKQLDKVNKEDILKNKELREQLLKQEKEENRKEQERRQRELKEINEQRQRQEEQEQQRRQIAIQQEQEKQQRIKQEQLEKQKQIQERQRKLKEKEEMERLEQERLQREKQAKLQRQAQRRQQKQQENLQQQQSEIKQEIDTRQRRQERNQRQKNEQQEEKSQQVNEYKQVENKEQTRDEEQKQSTKKVQEVEKKELKMIDPYFDYTVQAFVNEENKYIFRDRNLYEDKNDNQLLYQPKIDTPRFEKQIQIEKDNKQEDQNIADQLTGNCDNQQKEDQLKHQPKSSSLSNFSKDLNNDLPVQISLNQDKNKDAFYNENDITPIRDKNLSNFLANASEVKSQGIVEISYSKDCELSYFSQIQYYLQENPIKVEYLEERKLISLETLISILAIVPSIATQDYNQYIKDMRSKRRQFMLEKDYVLYVDQMLEIAGNEFSLVLSTAEQIALYLNISHFQEAFKYYSEKEDTCQEFQNYLEQTSKELKQTLKVRRSVLVHKAVEMLKFKTQILQNPESNESFFELFQILVLNFMIIDFKLDQRLIQRRII